MLLAGNGRCCRRPGREDVNAIKNNGFFWSFSTTLRAAIELYTGRPVSIAQCEHGLSRARHRGGQSRLGQTTGDQHSMFSLQGRQDIVAWLGSSGIDQVVIISPHLDDAVLSLFGLMSAVPEITEVVTVHTEGAPDVAAGWARAAGFADRIEEHAARRREDERAMQHIGCRFRHLGVRSRSGELSEASARHHVQTLWGPSAPRAASTLILLPAGAGCDRLISPAKQWIRRTVLRRLWMAHPEHQSTRDHFLKALSEIPAQLGFYADLPYASHVAPTQLADRLSESCSNPLHHVQIRADPKAKLRAVEFYGSQAELILGGTMSYKRWRLGHEEHLFLLPKDAHRVLCSMPASTAKSTYTPTSPVLQT
jgi:hypothetical protein